MKNRFLLITLAVFCLNLTLLAQDDDDPVNLDSIFPIDPIYQQMAADTCHAPVLEAVSVIHYQGYSKAYLEFQSVNASTAFFQASAGTGVPLGASLSGNKLLLGNLQQNQLYTLKMADNCGNVSESAVVNTKTTPDDMITVSVRLYNGIVRYLKENNGTPFPAFLEGLSGVSVYEKLAFVQQFYHKGQPFSVEDEILKSKFPRFENEDTCFCSSIRTVQEANPSKPSNVFKIIRDELQPGSGAPPTNLGGDSNARTWHYIANKGASKWHGLTTEGFKSKPGVDYDNAKTWTDSSGISLQQSKLRITLLCLDGDNVPQACSCNKFVKFWYRYDTRVKAQAELRYGTGSWTKNSVSQVEDLAIVSRLKESSPFDLKIINVLHVRAESHCNRTPNPNFWTNLTQVLSNSATLALAILGTTQGQDTTYSSQDITQVSNQIQTFFTNLGTFINTPYWNPSNCDNEEEVTGSIENPYTDTLRPNTPIQFAINSFDKLYSSGRRGWFASSNVNSSSYLAAFVTHGAFDGTPRHCCSPRIGTWVLSSCDGPMDKNTLKVQVANRLYEAGINNLVQVNFGNGLIVPGDFGYIAEPSFIEACNKIVVNPVGGGGNGGSGLGGNPGAERGTDDNNGFSTWSVWDFSGRLIATFDASAIGSLEKDWPQAIRGYLPTLASGVYYLHYTEAGKAKALKIFLP